MTLTGVFDNRVEADMAIERLVQKLGIERTDIFVVAAGTENTAGSAVSGSDREAIGQDARADAPLAGDISVSVDLQDSTHSQAVVATFAEFHGLIERS